MAFVISAPDLHEKINSFILFILRSFKLRVYLQPANLRGSLSGEVTALYKGLSHSQVIVK